MKFLLSTIVMFVMSMVIGFLVHGVLLSQRYAQPGPVPTAAGSDGLFPLHVVAHVFMAIGFVWVYTKGKEDKPLLIQGVRYGLAIAVLMTIPTYLIYYAVQAMPGTLVHQQIAFDTIGMVLMGILVAWLHR